MHFGLEKKDHAVELDAEFVIGGVAAVAVAGDRVCGIKKQKRRRRRRQEKKKDSSCAAATSWA